MNSFTLRIQIISIVISISFLFFLFRLIIKGKLREEYSIVWILSTLVLIFFSFWRNGLDVISDLVGVYSPPNLLFIGAIFAILIYLLHLSVVASRLHNQNKTLAQDIAILKQELEKLKQKNTIIDQITFE